MKFYYCLCSGGCEFDILGGPFPTDEIRTAAAVESVQSGGWGGEDTDTLFWLNLDDNGVPTMGAFLGGTFDDDSVDESQA